MGWCICLGCPAELPVDRALLRRPALTIQAVPLLAAVRGRKGVLQ